MQKKKKPLHSRVLEAPHPLGLWAISPNFPPPLFKAQLLTFSFTLCCRWVLMQPILCEFLEVFVSVFVI